MAPAGSGQGSDVVILSVKATLSSLQRLVAVNASPATAIVCGATENQKMMMMIMIFFWVKTC